MPERDIIVTVTNRTVVRTMLWILVAILLYKFIGRITHGLILIFVSFFLAMALNPVVSWTSRRLKIESRVRAVAVSYISVIAILVLFFAMIIPPLVRQTRTFIADVPHIVSDFQAKDSAASRSVRKYKLDEKLTSGAKEFASHYSNFGSTLLDTGKRVAEAVASFFVILVLTFMMLVEGPRWAEAFFEILPDRKRAHHRKIAYQMYRGVSGFVNGQVILAILAGIFSFTTLEIVSHIVDVSVNALALAGIVSVFGLIPLFGNTISSTIVVLVCLISSASLGLIMLIYFVIYFFVESHTFQPYIQSKLNNLTPLTVFIAAILGIGFGGLLGAIVAIPAATAVKILLEDQLEQRGLRKAT